ncbi:MAG: hypothetical protein OXI39_10985 [Gemmatimonadota bacterium]|uniref:hypothetical protein n=2 Tax=Candidatus Palauibacter scopulicola TaxID=3056741 RepID=UPI00238DCE10|nr:hypothetical protein [Candidatus Palauibacter scopulicola]MDE2663511.1 hypothetical protein [Candidatus Palauibacter scopulicola]
MPDARMAQAPRAGGPAAWTLPGLLVSLALSGGLTPARAQEWRDFRAARPLGDLEALEVELMYAGGRLDVSASETQLLYDVRLRYDAERSLPRREWRRAGRTGHLRLTTSSTPEDGRDSDDATRFGDLELELEDLPRNADAAGRLDLSLNSSVPTDLRLGIGAGRARLNLGGAHLTGLELITGAGDVEIGFARENRAALEVLSIKSGAAAFTAGNLGNARFRRLEFYGFVGDVVLDFSGSWRSSAEAEIRMGLGELVMRVPAHIGVRVRRSGLASLSAANFEKVGDYWLSPNWETARVRLEVTLVAGLGSVTVEHG